MRKKITSLALATVFMLSSLVGCSDTDSSSDKLNIDTTQKEDSGNVNLKVWAASEDQELVKQVADAFTKKYSSEAKITINVEPMEEGDCKTALLSDVLNAPDVYATTDGDIRILAAGGAASAVTNADEIKKNNLAAAVDAMTENGKLYAYPSTADNSYFLYYNKKYFKEDDVKNFNTILDIAASNDKKVVMDWSSGWYLYSFFCQTGLELKLNEDGVTNSCNWNSTDGAIKGVDVAKAMAEIASNPGFKPGGQADWLAGMEDGSVIACISGVWDEAAISKSLGKNYGAVKLPTYNVGDKQVQMGSYFGYKCIGVNSNSTNLEWAHKFAAFLTNEENQQLRFEMRGQGPTNNNVAKSEKLKNSVAVQAVLAQAEFSTMQRVGNNYWGPIASFASTILSGDVKDYQTLLDETVAAITSSTVQ